MNVVMLIQLKGNIPNCLHRIGGIVSKGTFQICILLYQIRKSFLVPGEVPWGTTINQPISQSIWRRGSREGRYKIKFLLLEFKSSIISKLSSGSIPFPFVVEPAIPLIVVVAPRMIVIIIMRCVPPIWTLPGIVTKLLQTKHLPFLPFLDPNLPWLCFFEPASFFLLAQVENTVGLFLFEGISNSIVLVSSWEHLVINSSKPGIVVIENSSVEHKPFRRKTSKGNESELPRCQQ